MNIKTLPANERGRDFVVGDLHGCYDQFARFLDFIKFDPSYDRMFSVGDLVDRGPKNMECLSLLRHPWFHAVKGNHEDLMLAYFDHRRIGQWWYPNGGGWYNDIRGTDEDAELRDDLLHLVKALPLITTVTSKFHVIHAEFLWDNELSDAILADEDLFMREAAQSSMDGDTIIWGRSLFSSFYGQDPDPQDIAATRQSVMAEQMAYSKGKITPIYCGHTPMITPTKVGHQINLDTMAFGTGRKTWAGLTFAEHDTGRFWKVQADTIEEVFMTTIV